ncbi:hypothetical protein O6H91_09G082100 [Diphasiastrum complanatum]|uniref:Uncharacterized protein n=1 Tax=Diphasiastrum complanatum TaxID=34168 RepID=A0ACC2CRE2_DIPCM|nr:hypothetical protein O6H91_09G082100 [Diphasiastrum complanatum]
MAGPLSAPPAAAPSRQQQQEEEDRTPYDGRGRAGGKLRSKRAAVAAAGSSGIRRSTPYERPSLGRHASAGPQAAAQLTRVSASEATAAKGLWLGGGIVSSASRILTTGASYLFSSLFGSSRSTENASEAAATGEEQQPDVPEKSTQAEESQFKEIENLLKGKSFTREQYNHFIDLLKAKVLDDDVVNTEAEVHRDDVLSTEQPQHALVPFEAIQAGNISHPDSQRWREERQRYRQEKANGGRRTVYEQGALDDQLPVTGKFKIEDSRVSSPVDIAKEYMDRRLSRASGSTLLARTPAFHEGGALDLRSSLQLAVRNPKMQGMVVGGSQKIKTSTSGENFSPLMPRSSRTPYTQSSRIIQRPGEIFPEETKPKIGSHWTPYQTPITGGREMLKRRSIVLEDGGTSTRPVRRTRIKTNSGLLTTGRVLGARSTSIASEPPVTLLTASTLKRSNGLTSDRGKISGDNRYMHENWDEIKLPDGLAFVPVQSSRTAQTILETLERMSPSPKGKSLEEELALVRERPPTRLSPSMLNKQAQRTMQAFEAFIPDSCEATSTEGLRNDPSVDRPSANRKLSTQSVKGKEKSEGARVEEVHATPSSSNGLASEAKGLERSMPAAGGTHARPRNPLNVPDVAVSEQVKSKGFRMSVDFEEPLSDDEGNVSTQALISNSIPPKSSNFVGSRPISFSMTATTTPMANLSSSSEATANSNSMPALEVHTSNSLVANVSIAEISPNFTSGFAFPLSSQSGANLELPPTPKPMPASLSQTEKPTVTSSSVPTLQDTKASISSTAPIFSVPSTSSAEQSDTKKGYPFTVPSSISQGQFSVKPLMDSSNSNVASTSYVVCELTYTNACAPCSNSNVASTSIFPTSFPKIQSASGSTKSTLVSKTSTSTGSSSSLPSASGFGSSFSAPSFPSFGFSGGAASSSPASLFAQSSISANSSIFGTAVHSSSNSSAPAIFSGSSSAAGSAFSTSTVSSAFAAASSTSTFSSVFASSSSLAATSSSEKSSIASPSMFSLAGFGQGSNTSSQQSASSTMSTPLFGNSASTSATISTAFPFGNSASASSAGNTASKPAPGFGITPFSFGSAASTASSIFGATSGSTFGLANTAPAFGGSTTFSASVSSVSAFGMPSAKPFGNFGQDTGSRSSSADNTFTPSFRAPTPPVGFSFTQSSAASAPAFSFGSTAAFGSSSGATESPFPFGAKSSPMFQQPPVFGSPNTIPTFGTPTNSIVPNDTNDQTIMEDSMAEEPSQITPTGPSQTSLFGTQTPQAASPFTFGGAPSNNAPPGQGLFTFVAQPTPVPNAFGAPAQNQFAQPSQSGSLDFAGGFALGSSGGERAGRKFIKAKRTVKRGK